MIWHGNLLELTMEKRQGYTYYEGEPSIVYRGSMYQNATYTNPIGGGTTHVSIQNRSTTEKYNYSVYSYVGARVALYIK